MDPRDRWRAAWPAVVARSARQQRPERRYRLLHSWISKRRRWQLDREIGASGCGLVIGELIGVQPDADQCAGPLGSAPVGELGARGELIERHGGRGVEGATDVIHTGERIEQPIDLRYVNIAPEWPAVTLIATVDRIE